jgi:hypothetical protein
MFDGDIQLTAVTAAVSADHNRAAAELGKRLAALAELDYSELRVEWRRRYRAHPPKKMSRDLLELGIAWKLQEKALGGLGASSKRRLADLALTMATRGDLVKARAVTLRPGARLVRHGTARRTRLWCWRMATAGGASTGAPCRPLPVRSPARNGLGRASSDCTKPWSGHSAQALLRRAKWLKYVARPQG